jgi:Cys-tRNA synthase (O-phospho-L-seryl-tRNA:Cys-tRNA synthase)
MVCWYWSDIYTIIDFCQEGLVGQVETVTEKVLVVLGVWDRAPLSI